MKKQTIDFTEFLDLTSKLSISIGKVLECVRVPKSSKLLQLTVSFGDEERTVVTNLGQTFVESDFIGKYFQFVMNLEPTRMMGVVSEAMIMVGEKDGVVTLENHPEGSKIL